MRLQSGIKQLSSSFKTFIIFRVKPVTVKVSFELLESPLL